MSEEVADVAASREDAKSPPDRLSVTTAKWLVPTAGGLFVLLGYVVETAQRSMLGVSYGKPDASDYTASAAEFLRDVVTRIVQALIRLLSFEAVPLADNFWWIALEGALLFAAVRAPRWATRWATRRGHLADADRPRFRWLLPFALAVLVASKFLAFDAPLTNVENVILRSGDDTGAVANERDRRGTTLTTRLLRAAEDGGVEGVISHRAAQLYDEMTCAHTDAVARARVDALKYLACNADDHAARDQAAAEFDALLLLGVLVAVAAGGLLRTRALWVDIVCIVCLASLLTVPYAYGKLIKSTFFDFGIVHYASSFRPAQAARNKDDNTSNALVLARDADGPTLLVATTQDCAPSGKRSVVTLVTPSPDSVLGIDEIYRKDVLAWALAESWPCDGAAARSPTTPVNADAATTATSTPIPVPVQASAPHSPPRPTDSPAYRRILQQTGYPTENP